MKPIRKKAGNCKINPVLYDFFLRLKNTLGAEIVHRRRRKSTTCIEIVFHSEHCQYLKNRLNTIKEAEACGFYIICRRQTKRGHETWHGQTVFQLFLTPVHPKKSKEAMCLAAHTSEEVSFVPIKPKRSYKPERKCRYRTEKLRKICTREIFFVPLQPQRFRVPDDC